MASKIAVVDNSVMDAGQPHPNFFIVGAAKSGTTSLAKYLGQHPDIFMPTWNKEPAFFADHTGYDRWEDYLCEFRGAASCPAVGEKSVAHLYDSQAAERIHRFNPRAKIIISLRHPVDMAYSLYRHNRRHGYETLSTFAEALAAEDERAESSTFPRESLGYYANYLYKRRATYFPQIKKYVDAFGSSRVLLVRFSDLKSDSLSVCRTIFRFLGVDDSFVPSLKPENRGGAARLPFLQHWYVRSTVFRNVIVRTTPQSLRKFVKRLNQRPSPNYVLASVDRDMYSPMFSEDLRRVEEEYAFQVA